MDPDAMYQSPAEDSATQSRGSRDSHTPAAGDARDRSNSPATRAQQQRSRKKRVRNWTADDRAAHRVFEKSRREAFRDRLTVCMGFSNIIIVLLRLTGVIENRKSAAGVGRVGSPKALQAPRG